MTFAYVFKVTESNWSVTLLPLNLMKYYSTACQMYVSNASWLDMKGIETPPQYRFLSYYQSDHHTSIIF